MKRMLFLVFWMLLVFDNAYSEGAFSEGVFWSSFDNASCNHLSAEDVEIVQKNCVLYSCDRKGILDCDFLIEHTCFDKLLILAAKDDRDNPVFPYRFLYMRKNEAGESVMKEEWCCPEESIGDCRERCTWNILTDPVYISPELNEVKNWQKVYDISKFPGMTIEENLGSYVKLSINNAGRNIRIRNGYAKIAPIDRILVDMDVGMVSLPTWREDDGAYGKMMSYVRAIGGSEGKRFLWSVAIYTNTVNETTKYRIRYRAWESLFAKHLVSTACCSGGIDFLAKDGIVVDGKFVASGDADVEMLWRSSRYESHDENGWRHVQFEKIPHMTISYDLAKSDANISRLRSSGIIEWNDYEIRFSGSKLRIFDECKRYMFQYRVREQIE